MSNTIRRLDIPEGVDQAGVSGQPRHRSISNGNGTPPAAPDVERALIGACLLDELAFSHLAGLLPAEALFDGRHRMTYAAMQALFDAGQPTDLVSLTEELRRRQHLEKVGGVSFLSACTDAVASTASVEHHARIILEKWYLRRLGNLARQLRTRAQDPTEDAFEVLNFAEKEVFQIGQQRAQGRPEALGDGLEARAEEICTTEAPDGVTGLATGFRKLDRLTAGWQPGDLIIVAGRPSHGKTAFALRQALESARAGAPNRGVLLFSLEMSAQSLRNRILASEARVDSSRMRRLALSPEEKHRLREKAAELKELPIWIDYSPGLSASQLRAKARQAAHAHDVSLVIVDYLQLMEGGQGTREAESRELQIAHISRSLKGLAGELGVPVIALSQLSRAVESRGGDKRPILSDLRRSGQIEQDADVVAFVYRAEQYGIYTDENGNSTEGICEIIIGKQRNGPTGAARIAFVKQFAAFEELSPAPLPTPTAPPPNQYF